MVSDVRVRTEADQRLISWSWWVVGGRWWVVGGGRWAVGGGGGGVSVAMNVTVVVMALAVAVIVVAVAVAVAAASLSISPPPPSSSRPLRPNEVVCSLLGPPQRGCVVRGRQGAPHTRRAPARLHVSPWLRLWLWLWLLGGWRGGHLSPLRAAL